MTNGRYTKFLLAFVGIVLAGIFTIALAQDSDEREERSAFIEYVEQQISTPDRQIRLGAIDGVLSSDVGFSEITIADREGVWLRIENVRMVWSRLALLGGRLQIDELEADSIVMERQPLPPEEAMPEEAQLRIPELPLATNIGRLAVERVTFAEDVFGLGSELAVEGRLRLDSGDLDTELAIERLDGPGGSLELSAVFDGSAETLDLDLELSEPDDGVVANLLDLRGRPSLSFTIAGSGPLEDYTASIRLLADEQELLAGTTQVARVADGFRLVADVEGRLGELAPPAYADLFGASSTLKIDATRADDGSVSIARADIVSGVMSMTARADLASDLFPLTFDLDARLAASDADELVHLPFGDGTVVRRARIRAGIGGDDDETWSAVFDMEGLETGPVSMERATVTAEGLARNRDDAEAREVTFDISGSASGVSSSDEGLADALGSRLDLAASGDWTHGQPIAIEQARVETDTVAMRFAGTFMDELFDGDYRISVPDLASFSGVAGRALGGAAELSATGEVGMGLNRFALTLDGTADDIRVDVAALDRLFAGRATLSGAVARNDEGLRFDNLVLDHANARARLAGRYASEEVDVTLVAELPDIAALGEQASGAARLDVALTGTGEQQAIDATLGGTALTLLDTPFKDAQARFAGTVAGRDVTGDFTVSGELGGVAIEGATRVSTVDGLLALTQIDLRAGETALTGDLTVHPGGLMSGALRFDSPDLSVIGPLALTEMAGSVSAGIDLSVADGEQAARVRATARDVRAGESSLGSADIDLTGEDLWSAPMLSGSLEASAIVAGPVRMRTLSANARRTDDRTALTATAQLDQGRVEVAGRLDPKDGGLDIALDTLDLREGAIDVTLSEPVTVAVRNGTIAIPTARLTVGGGNVVVAGEIGRTIDMEARAEQLDLAVANVFAPDLGMAGTVSGTLDVTGPARAPRGNFNLQGTGLSARLLREAGIQPVGLEARGDIVDGTATLDARLSGGGVSLTVVGDVPLDGPGLDLAITGSLPLSAADLVLAARGASLSGTLNIDARVTGTLADPDFSGTLTANGATFVDAEIPMRLTDISLRAGLSADRLVIETLSARAARGTVTGSGSVGIGNGFPADLEIALSDFRYQDDRLVTAVLNGTLTLSGPLLERPVLGGTITIARAEITVPENIPETVTVLDIVHHAAPAAVRETLRRARMDEPGRQATRSGLVLDLTIEAPARLFVRGRGIDAEFGGTVRLDGPVSNIRALGSFDLRRGHVAIIGRRVEFTSGTVTMAGDIDPMLDFAATSQAGSITVTANISGRASDPDITLTSVPELPQDEIFAQFLFGRSLGELSPLQIAQLASAAAGLVGGNDSGGLLGRLRGATGLDELDVVVGQEGGVAVQTGRYVTDNIYLGVRAGEKGEAGVTINLDLTDNITARGESGSDGQSKIGIFFKREY